MTRNADLASYEEIFDEAIVEELIKAARSRISFDRRRLRQGVIDAAKIYSVRLPVTGNKIRREIEALYAAALKRRFDKVADLLAELPPNVWGNIATRARAIIEREERWAQVFAAVPEAGWQKRRNVFHALAASPGRDLLNDPLLSDPLTRDDVCAAIQDLCQLGSEQVESRMRPSGRRSRSWKPRLIAPEMQKNPKIRDAERAFVMWLQLAWWDATETMPARTAHRDNRGPFARFAQTALNRIGAAHASAVELINDLAEARKEPVRAQSLKDDRVDDI